MTYRFGSAFKLSIKLYSTCSNRRNGIFSMSFSDFAFRYIFILSSCSYGRLYHLVPASLWLKDLPTIGPLCSPGITPVHSYYGPLRHPPIIISLPSVYWLQRLSSLAISCWDKQGFSSCSVYPCYHAVAITPLEQCKRNASLVCLCCLHLQIAGSASRVLFRLRGHLCVYFRYGLVTCLSPFVVTLSMGFRRFGYPPLCHSSYRASDFYPDRTYLLLNIPA